MRGENTLTQPTFSRKDSPGVESGLTERSDFMSDAPVVDASFNESTSKAASGGFSRQAKGQRTSESASSKGKSFEVEGCKY